MAYQIKLPVFEGPFDLLFHLIDKNEVDIYDIPIARITGQYLEYLATMHMLDLEVASEFLLMAATLLSIKSRMLLPKPPVETPDEDGDFAADPRDELVERLLEYKKFKQLADYLKEKETGQEKVYTRPNEEEMFMHLFSEENPVEGISLDNLLTALKDVLERSAEVELTGEIAREEVTIRDKMKEIMHRLFFQPKGIAFRDLFRMRAGRVEIVVTFLGLLELIKLGKIRVYQSGNFGEIMIYSRLDKAAEA